MAIFGGGPLSGTVWRSRAGGAWDLRREAGAALRKPRHVEYTQQRSESVR
jgi:hypothetical protein